MWAAPSSPPSSTCINLFIRSQHTKLIPMKDLFCCLSLGRPPSCAASSQPSCSCTVTISLPRITAHMVASVAHMGLWECMFVLCVSWAQCWKVKIMEDEDHSFVFIYFYSFPYVLNSGPDMVLLSGEAGLLVSDHGLGVWLHHFLFCDLHRLVNVSVFQPHLERGFWYSSHSIHVRTQLNYGHETSRIMLRENNVYKG